MRTMEPYKTLGCSRPPQLPRFSVATCPISACDKAHPCGFCGPVRQACRCSHGCRRCIQQRLAACMQPTEVCTSGSPSCVVAELMARGGMTVMSGATLFRINGLGTVWANAEVPKSQVALLRPGAKVQASSPAAPGAKFEGKDGGHPARGQPDHPNAEGAARTGERQWRLGARHVRVDAVHIETPQLALRT